MTRVDLFRVVWRKSSRSGLNGGSDKCVRWRRWAMAGSRCETASTPAAPCCSSPAPSWHAWISGVRNDEFTDLA